MFQGTRALTPAHLFALAAALPLGIGCGSEAQLDTFEGRLEAALALAESRADAFATFANGSHDPDDIAKGRIPEPPGGTALEQDLLRLVESAESFSEARRDHVTKLTKLAKT